MSSDAEIGRVVREWLEDESTPWPIDIWSMTLAEYWAAIPDGHLQKDISRLLMREGWRMAVQTLRRAIEEDEMNRANSKEEESDV